MKRFILAILLGVLLCLNACGSYATDKKEQDEEKTTIASNPMGWNGIGEISDESAKVNTPYGDIYYPLEYADLLNVDITDMEYYGVSFSGRSSVGDVFLMAVYFDCDDYGEYLGSFIIDDSEHSLSYEVFPLSLDNRWSEDEKERLAKEQEEVTAYVVNFLQENENFLNGAK